MPEDVHEECGVAAIYLHGGEKGHPVGGAAYYLYQMLLQMQNRGQLSAGITTYNADRQQLIDTHRKQGTVNEVFSSRVRPKMEGLMKKYSGDRGIGHLRYATMGPDEKGAAQPFERHHGRTWKWFALGFNGNLANFTELKQKLQESKYHLIRDLDTEVVMHFIAKQFLGDKKVEFEEVFGNVAELFDGAYNLTYINAEGAIVAVRDPHGFKPLSYTTNGTFTAAASESVAIEALGEEKFQSLQPGEMLIVENGSIETKRFAKCKKKAHCMFEWVYFANPGSTLDGSNVYQVRRALGRELARIEPLDVNSDDYVVVGVPDTSKPAADAYAHELGMESMEGLLRNRYIGRTFIENKNRDARAREKYSFNKAVLRGKKVILVEDSVVRGTTSKVLVDSVKKIGGAKEVHLRVSCPPIRSPCFYGIDMSTMDELAVPKYIKKDELRQNAGLNDVSDDVIENLRKEIKADSLVYNSVKGLINAINMENGEKDLCLACVNCDYITEWGRRLADKSVEEMGKNTGKRTYE